MTGKYSVLQRIMAAWMLLVFLFAITPHVFVHDVVTHHQDTVDSFHKDTEVSLHHTHCEYLHVVHAPFSSVEKAFVIKPDLIYQDCINTFIPYFYAAEEFFSFMHRGPPII